MQQDSGISASEWRWVIIFSGLLIAVTLLPYAWAFASDSPSDTWQFMGILANPLDGATYISKIGQGAQGAAMFTLQYTPESHPPVAIHEFYILLGHIARLFNLSPILMFHIARLATGLFMYTSIYHLGAVIWTRLRARRLFFSLLAVGSGLGWFMLLFNGANLKGFDSLPTDFSMPESIPFFATYANPHFPLTIGIIAMVAAMFIRIFRPGFNEHPTLSNGGAILILLSVALTLTQPQGLLPMMVTLGVYMIIMTYRRLRIPMMELNWVVLFILPALPILIYYFAITQANSAIQVWNAQNETPSPPILNYVFGYGIILIVALPGIWRGIRHFERDGDRYMIIWLIVNILLLYAPFNLQRRFAIGLMIPIVYFAVRALEDFWFHRILPPWRDAALVAVFVFIVPSNVLSLGIPIVGVANPASGIDGSLLLYNEHSEAIRWLGREATAGDVVLAPRQVSLWIPAYTSLRVVYGHEFETVNAKQKLEEVTAWYNGENCQQLIEAYKVSYIVSEYQANQTRPQTGCYMQFGEPLASFNNRVFIYSGIVSMYNPDQPMIDQPMIYTLQRLNIVQRLNRTNQ